MAIGAILQSPAIFLVLSGILWWSVLIPRLNPFDALFNRTLANRPGAVRLEPAPPPRRFAQGMAGSFALAIGILLLFQRGTAALVLKVLLLAALAALIFGRFCLGSFLYHLHRGRSDFAIGTLPWKPGTFPTAPRADPSGLLADLPPPLPDSGKPSESGNPAMPGRIESSSP